MSIPLSVMAFNEYTENVWRKSCTLGPLPRPPCEIPAAQTIFLNHV